ncbi:hypothetical protein [Desulfoscipio gibsoniae]
MDNDKFQELVLQQFQVMDKRFQAIDKRFESIDQRFEGIDQRFETMDKRFATITGELQSLKEGQARLEKSQDILATEVIAIKSKTNEIDTKLTKLSVRVENEIEPKINALFAGQKQHTEQLVRIEAQVSKHEEFILKRIK